MRPRIFAIATFATVVTGSAMFSDTARAAVPAAPTALRAKETSGNVSLTWRDQSNNENRFILQRGSRQATLATFAYPFANFTSANDTVSPGEIRVYRIRAGNAEGTSAWSNVCWVNANPQQPTRLAVDSRNPAIRLSWRDNSSTETKFRLQRRLKGQTSFVTIANLAPNTTMYQDESINRFSTYEYRVRALGRPKACIEHSSWSAVTASAPADNKLLTVNKSGTGSGTVTSSPIGIDCGEDCVALYPTNTTVTLSADSSPGSRFAGWSGACSGQSSQCQVMLNINKSVTARFEDD